MGAGRFVLAVGARLQALPGVSQELFAGRAKVPAAVAVSAEEANHGLDGFSLPFDPGVALRHGFNIVRPAPDGKGSLDGPFRLSACRRVFCPAG